MISVFLFVFDSNFNLRIGPWRFSKLLLLTSTPKEKKNSCIAFGRQFLGFAIVDDFLKLALNVFLLQVLILRL